ncbi:MAG: hypothetical protein QOJ13_949 [Gaiellales bacterium]|jgi:hypothetical protein|nr:hypothetical protein [Gaiellales bacterium]
MHPDGPVANRTDDPNNTIDEAFEFFDTEVRDWALHEGAQEAERRLETVAEVLWSGVSLVVIDLGDGDEAQVIFETLNARGTPLLAFDLVKNLVFRRAQEEGLSLDALHSDVWSKLEVRYWRELIGRGHRQRPRSEQFLLHWLTMREGSEIPPAEMFRRFDSRFQAEADGDVRSFVDSFCRDAGVWKGFGEQPERSYERLFFQRLGEMGVLTAHPLLLLLFRSNPEELDPRRRRRLLRMLESWLVRRMILKLNTRNYGDTFSQLIAVVGQDLSRADDLTLEWLRAQTGESAMWPNDAAVIDACVSVPMYQRQLNVTRTKLLLAGIELGMRTDLSEEIDLPPTLHIEHVLPQTWSLHWPVRGEAAEECRHRHVHVLGNLTLVTKRLNSTLSNAAWVSMPEGRTPKRETLNKHSVLLLNRRLVDGWPERWDEETIDDRGRQLASVAVDVWPGPSAWE